MVEFCFCAQLSQQKRRKGHGANLVFDKNRDGDEPTVRAVGVGTHLDDSVSAKSIKQRLD